MLPGDGEIGAIARRMVRYVLSPPRAGFVAATPGGQRFHTWIGASAAPWRAWARYSESRMIDTVSPAPASPAGTT